MGSRGSRPAVTRPTFNALAFHPELEWLPAVRSRVLSALLRLPHHFTQAELEAQQRVYARLEPRLERETAPSLGLQLCNGALVTPGHPELAHTLPRLLAFGATTAEVLYREQGGDSALATSVARLGAAFNAAICCIDRITDEEREHLLWLRDRLTADALRFACHTRRATFSNGVCDTDPVLPRVALRLLDTFLSQAFALWEAGPRDARILDDIGARLAVLLQDHECATAMSRAKHPPRRLRDRLRRTKAGPFAVIASCCALTRPNDDLARQGAIARAAFLMGDAFRWTDDLADAFEDLERGTWSSLWVHFVRLGGRLATAPHRLRDALIDSGFADGVINHIAHRVARLDRRAARTVAAWIAAWFS